MLGGLIKVVPCKTVPVGQALVMDTTPLEVRVSNEDMDTLREEMNKMAQRAVLIKFNSAESKLAKVAEILLNTCPDAACGDYCNAADCDSDPGFHDCLTRKLWDILTDAKRSVCPNCHRITSEQELDENRGVCALCLESGEVKKHGGMPDEQ